MTAEEQETTATRRSRGRPSKRQDDGSTSSPESTELTPKAQQTREHILTTALALFSEKGYAATTMRDIAARAGCSLGLAYRYFNAKEDLVLALYARCAEQLVEEVAHLPKAPLAERWHRAIIADIDRLVPYRATMGALFGVALLPGSDLAVLGDRVAGIRRTVWTALLHVIEGASDAPKPKQAHELATLAYAAHLALILFWLQDTSPNQKATGAVLVLSKDILKRIRPILNVPPVPRYLTRLVSVISPMFGPVEPPAA